MISAIFLINLRGEIVISRLYRDDVSLQAANAFRVQVIAAKEAGQQPPIKNIDGTTFLYIRHRNMFFVAITRQNANPGLIIQFLYSMVEIFKGYFSSTFDENSIRDNFTLVYELLDEVLDFGYPQTSSLEVLQLAINLGKSKKPLTVQEEAKMTGMLTGAKDWRREGIFYQKNEVYLDVLESVNLLMSNDGNILRSDVTGQINMKSYLSGMPECKFALNDKLVMDREANRGAAKKKRHRSVELDDCTFHRCVQLSKFDADRSITFVPPDGEFELMRYRVTDHINLPFRVIPIIEEMGKGLVTVNVKISANFGSQLIAGGVVMRIPVPPNTARAKCDVSMGRAKYEPGHRAITWRIRRFPGGAQYQLGARVELAASTKDKAWSRPPLSLDFQVPMFTASGLFVRSLKVFEKSSYETKKWVKYVTRAGSYQIRIQ